MINNAQRLITAVANISGVLIKANDTKRSYIPALAFTTPPPKNVKVITAWIATNVGAGNAELIWSINAVSNFQVSLFIANLTPNDITVTAEVTFVFLCE